MAVSVYLLTFPNNKCYVGVSQDVVFRLKSHLRGAVKGKAGLLCAAIRKYGEPSIQILHEARNHEEAWLLEIQEILTRQTKAPMGYNLTDGGDGSVGLPKDIIKARTVKIQKSFMKNTTPKQRRQYGLNAYAASVVWWEELSDEEKLCYQQRRKDAAKQHHNTMSPEAKAKWKKNQSKASKLMWGDPSYRENRAKTFSKPEVKKKMVAHGHNSIEVLKESNRARTEKDKGKINKKISSSVKDLWANPEYRAKQMTARAKRKQKLPSGM